MNVAFFTLGCKANQFETEAIRNDFIKSGYNTVDFNECADIYVINTCAVTAMSEAKSRRALRKCKKINPGATVIVCGCYSQIDAAALRECGADYLIGSGDKSRILSIACGTARDGVTQLRPGQPGFDMLTAGVFQRTRAMLKIQDGCDNFCAYCIIPFARGPVRSMPRESVLEHVRSICEHGYNELVLTGIEISAYGEDFDEQNGLCSLLEDICTSAPNLRIRLGSLDPRTVDDSFLSLISRHGNICPHFHLSLQSGCDKTLSAMGRRYTTDFYLKACKSLRSARPNCAITTDLIVGFPGESEADFESTLMFIQECNFAAMHIFPYSLRNGTKAAVMPMHIEKSVKEKRAAQGAAYAKKMQSEFMKNQVGQTLSVLFEEETKGFSSGHSENYCIVRCKGTDLNNTVKSVIIEDYTDTHLLGRIY